MKRADDDKEDKKIRYAVVGLGYISQIAILPAFAHAKENSELVALVSSDPTKLQELGKRYSVKNTYSYDRFADCLGSGDVDAVYIALPNNMHRDYTIASAQAGVHVLCEKPMAFNQDDCQVMIDAANEARIKLMIAYRLHFEEGNTQAIKTIQSGLIGEARIFTSSFSQQVQEGNSRLKADIGGGPLYDMGVYCINAARYLFRAEPLEVFSWNSTPGGDPRFQEVPATTSALMKFPGDRIASFSCSFGAANRSVFEVIGTEGVLKMDPAYELAEDLTMEVTLDGRTKKKNFKKRDQFAPELIHFSDCILHDQQPKPSGKEGLADVRVIQALLESAQKNQPVAVVQTQIPFRPDETQEISRKAVSPPPLVKAAAPGRH